MSRIPHGYLAATLSASLALFGCASHKPSSPKLQHVAPLPNLASGLPASMSADAKSAVEHIRTAADNDGAPFMVIDKKQAHVWVFNDIGQPVGDGPVLLGKARGDHTTPGIGDKPLAKIKEHERTTPAGRFVIEPGRNAHGDNVLWIDYDAAVSMHVVRSVDRGERRAERLVSPSPDDNRISYGCINVDAKFFDAVLDKTFGPGRHRHPGIAYVLPETRPMYTLFESSGLASSSR